MDLTKQCTYFAELVRAETCRGVIDFSCLKVVHVPGRFTHVVVEKLQYRYRELEFFMHNDLTRALQDRTARTQDGDRWVLVPCWCGLQSERFTS